MSGANVRNLEKIQDKWLLFQRFVTSIVVPSTIKSQEKKYRGEHFDHIRWVGKI